MGSSLIHLAAVVHIRHGPHDECALKPCPRRRQISSARKDDLTYFQTTVAKPVITPKLISGVKSLEVASLTTILTEDNISICVHKCQLSPAPVFVLIFYELLKKKRFRFLSWFVQS